MRRSILFVALLLLVPACGDDDTSVTTGASSTTTSTTAAPTTTAAATTSLATTTTAATGFTADDLAGAVLADGDPWVVPISGVATIPLTIDDVWPLEGSLTFPEEHAIYDGAGFVGGYFGSFTEPDGTAIVLTGAHLFADAAGAAVGLDMITQSFNDPELVAAITGLAPGSLTMSFPMPLPGVGDDGSGVLLSGQNAQVIGYVWTTANLLQFVRIGAPLGDEDRAAAAVTLVQALADRTAR